MVSGADRQIHSLISAVHLRSYVRMINQPDRVVDHLIASYTGLPPGRFTEDEGLACRLAMYLAPDLDRIEVIRLNGTLFGAKAFVGEKVVQCNRAAYDPAIPICLVGLNRRIETLMDLTGVNNFPNPVDGESPIKYVLGTED